MTRLNLGFHRSSLPQQPLLAVHAKEPLPPKKKTKTQNKPGSGKTSALNQTIFFIPDAKIKKLTYKK